MFKIYLSRKKNIYIYLSYATLGVFLQGKLTFWNFEWLELDWLNIVHQIRHLFCGHGLTPSSPLEAGVKITFPESALSFPRAMIKWPKRAEDYHASSENGYRQQKMDYGRKEKQHLTLHSAGWEEGGLGAAPGALWDQRYQHHLRACERCSLSAPWAQASWTRICILLRWFKCTAKFKKPWAVSHLPKQGVHRWCLKLHIKNSLYNMKVSM